MKLETSLEDLESIDLPHYNWMKLLECLGQDLDNPDLSVKVSLRFILENNGLDDAILSLRAFPELAKPAAWFALFCAENVRYLMKDERSTKALDVARRHLLGDATRQEAQEAATGAFLATYKRVKNLGAASTAYSAVRTAWFYTSRDLWCEEVLSTARWARGEANNAQAAQKTQDIIKTQYVIYKIQKKVSEAERTAQEAEFKRMLDCIESGQEYKI